MPEYLDDAGIIFYSIHELDKRHPGWSEEIRSGETAVGGETLGLKVRSSNRHADSLKSVRAWHGISKAKFFISMMCQSEWADRKRMLLLLPLLFIFHGCFLGAILRRDYERNVSYEHSPNLQSKDVVPITLFDSVDFKTLENIWLLVPPDTNVSKENRANINNEQVDDLGNLPSQLPSNQLWLNQLRSSDVRNRSPRAGQSTYANNRVHADSDSERLFGDNFGADNFGAEGLLWVPTASDGDTNVFVEATGADGTRVGPRLNDDLGSAAEVFERQAEVEVFERQEEVFERQAEVVMDVEMGEAKGCPLNPIDKYLKYGPSYNGTIDIIEALVFYKPTYKVMHRLIQCVRDNLDTFATEFEVPPYEPNIHEWWVPVRHVTSWMNNVYESPIIQQPPNMFDFESAGAQTGVQAAGVPTDMSSATGQTTTTIGGRKSAVDEKTPLRRKTVRRKTLRSSAASKNDLLQDDLDSSVLSESIMSDLVVSDDDVDWDASNFRLFTVPWITTEVITLFEMLDSGLNDWSWDKAWFCQTKMNSALMFYLCLANSYPYRIQSVLRCAGLPQFPLLIPKLPVDDPHKPSVVQYTIPQIEIPTTEATLSQTWVPPVPELGNKHRSKLASEGMSKLASEPMAGSELEKYLKIKRTMNRQRRREYITSLKSKSKIETARADETAAVRRLFLEYDEDWPFFRGLRNVTALFHLEWLYEEVMRVIDGAVRGMFHGVSLFFLIISCGFLGMINMNKWYSLEPFAYQCIRNNVLGPMVYFVSFCCQSWILVFYAAIFITVPFVLIASIPLETYFCVFVTSILFIQATSGYLLILGQILPAQGGIRFATIFMVCFVELSGFFIRERNYPHGSAWLTILSPYRWGSEAIFAYAFKENDYSSITEIPQTITLALVNSKVRNFWVCWIYLIVTYFTTLLITAFCYIIKLRHRSTKELRHIFKKNKIKI
ncbi:putative transmembrane protein [Gregarina niphandrodes]|uniref:Transmembrane protein n=1 Tax=Gregarina niphandrodes TaxID=110365 RepID=A0A023B0Y1_GRENI|nr:putative transmembrane protein [Gregarina niphandrodes]EZG46018.1 putative transmembrane protein [Gregarina niphandrodes]|eukprot:XP_011132392.1 putative transmembrane protein [Gregarina niphandrodes]